MKRIHTKRNSFRHLKLEKIGSSELIFLFPEATSPGLTCCQLRNSSLHMGFYRPRTAKNQNRVLELTTKLVKSYEGRFALCSLSPCSLNLHGICLLIFNLDFRLCASATFLAFGFPCPSHLPWCFCHSYTPFWLRHPTPCPPGGPCGFSNPITFPIAVMWKLRLILRGIGFRIPWLKNHVLRKIS